jgi:hypothetical protein
MLMWVKRLKNEINSFKINKKNKDINILKYIIFIK